MQSNNIKCEYESQKKYSHNQPFFFCKLCNYILCYKCYPVHLTNDNLYHNENSILALDNNEILYNSMFSKLKDVNKKIKENKNVYNEFYENTEKIIKNINDETKLLFNKINSIKNSIIDSIVYKKNLFNFCSEIKAIKERIKNMNPSNFSKEELISIINDKNKLNQFEKNISNKNLLTYQTAHFSKIQENWMELIKKIGSYFDLIKDLNLPIISKNNVEQQNEKQNLGKKKQRDLFLSKHSPIKKQKTEETKKEIILSQQNKNKKDNEKTFESMNIQNSVDKNKNHLNNYSYHSKYFFSIHCSKNSLGKILVYNSLKKSVKIYQIKEEYFKNEKYTIFPFLYSKGVNTNNAFYLTGGTLNSILQKLTFKITFNEQLKRPEIENFTSMNYARKNHNILFIESKNEIIVCSGNNNLTCEKINLNNPTHWDLLPNLNSIRMNGTFFSIKDKYIYLVGGFDSQSETYMNGYELLDYKEKKSWDYYDTNIDFKSTMGVINLYNKVIFFGGYNGEKILPKNLIEVTFENNQIHLINEKKNFLEKGIVLYHSQMLYNFDKKYLGYDKIGSLIEFDVDTEKVNIHNKHLKNL